MQSRFKIIRNVIAVCILCIMCAFVTACSCSEMDSAIVCKNFEDFINKENDIFSFDKEGNFVTTFTYQDNVANALEKEKTIYNSWLGGDKSNTFSDFYIIKAIYEPILTRSMAQIGSLYKYMDTNANDIDREKANAVNEAIKVVENTMPDLLNSMQILDNNDATFAEGGDYRNASKSIYNELKNIKKSYENMIKACFDLNNLFMDMYLSSVTNYDFNKVNLSDLVQVSENKYILNEAIYVYAYSYMNYMISVLTDISFLVDGNECSFVSSYDSFAVMYTGVNTSEEFADKYMVTDNYNEIKDCVDFNLNSFKDDIISKENVEEGDKLDEVQPYANKLLKYLQVCQNRFESLLSMLPYFKQALDEVNYKDYIVNKENKSFEEYIDTLDEETRTHFVTINEFLSSYFAPLAQTVKDFQINLIV